MPLSTVDLVRLDEASLGCLDILNRPIWIFDMSGRRMWWGNNAAVVLWGCESREEFLAADCSNPSPAVAARLAQYRRAFARGETVREQWTVYPGGKPRTVNCICSGVLVDVDRHAMLVEADPPGSDIEADALRGLEALRHAPAAVSLFGRDRQLLFQNPSAASLFPDGANLDQRLGGRSQEALEALWQVGAWSAEVEDPGAEGSRWYAINALRVLDPTNGEAAILVQQTDITARRDSEEELRATRERLQSLLSSTSDGVCGIDEAGITTFFNAAATAITGWQEADVLGRPIHSFLHCKDTNGRPLPLTECPIYSTFRTGRVERVAEDVFWRKNGSGFPVEYVSSPMMLGDRIAGAVVVFRDISERLENEQALRRRTRQLEAISASLENAQRIAKLGNWDFVVADDTLWWSPEIYRIFGVAQGSFVPSYAAFLEFVHPDDRAAVNEAVERALAGHGYEILHRIVCPDGSEKIVQECGEVVFGDGGQPVRMTGTVQDVTERKRREADLHMLWTAVTEVPVGIFITDRDGRIEYANPAISRMTGYQPDELIGNTPRILKSGNHEPRFYESLWNSILAGQGWHGEICNRRKDGTPYWEEMVISPLRDDHGEVVQFVAIKTDVTARREMQAQIEHLAFHDPLTGLPNRSYFEQRLRYAEALCRRVGHAVAIVYIDLDGFKAVNDDFGHDSGDRLLKEIAGRLVACVREVDVLARLGGDEFVALLLLGEDGACGEATLVASRMIREVSAPVYLDGCAARVGASIGIAVYPDCGATIQECLRLADVAMYDAKKNGKNRYSVFGQ